MQPDRPVRCYERVMDDSTLLAALANDLDPAFEALVHARQDRLYSIALRMLGDPTEAEDAAQDAFIRAYRALATWEATRIRELRLDAWLATIVANVTRTRIRRRATSRSRESLTFIDELDHPMAASGETPHERLAGTEARRAWATRLLALPERYRAPVVLRHVDGLAYDDIAIALDRPEGTVKAQVHRGLALLRAMVDRELRAELEAAPSVNPGGAPSNPLPIPRLQEVSS
jgi:RNA polymerase sigma-70 factor, ECF subfamily